MSTDNPRRRIDWNGEGQMDKTSQLLKSRGFLRKASVPAAIGLTGLALIGALAAGPIMRSMTGSQADMAQAVTDTVETAALVQQASAEEPATVEPAASTPATPQPETPATTAARTPAPASTDSAGLDANDPRWNPTALAVDEGKLAALRQAVDETVAAAEIATAMGNSAGLATSGIPSTAAGFAPERPTAASSERSAFDAALVTEDEQIEAEPAIASNLTPAKATQYVNMRAAPDDGAAVLAVVPANATIEAEADCRWCEVSYEGKTGYIYRSFIARN